MIQIATDYFTYFFVWVIEEQLNSA